MNSSQIKEKVQIVDLLSCLGYTPKQIKGKNYWYISMIREPEKTASLVVDTSNNVWYDHGAGLGGKIIDLSLKLFKTNSISIVLEKIEDTLHSSPITHQISLPNPLENTYQEVGKIEVISVNRLTSKPLLNYLNQRGISSEIATLYCKEYLYKNIGKEFVSIGFQNVSGGAELRSPSFKSTIAPKTYSLISNNGKSLVIFEGFMDFLSYQMLQEVQISNSDFLILNSLSFITRIEDALLEQYQKVYLFLDNDIAGKGAVQKLKRRAPIVVDMSMVYIGHKDLNEYLLQNR